MYSYIIDILNASWMVLGQMAPYLLFGFLAAGILSELISEQWVQRHLGSGGLESIVKASIFGVPLPLCSCGVIPVAASLRKQGASRPATMSFLLSTPQTGVDSIFATYSLMGPIFALARPIVAFITGIIGGILVAVFDPEKKENSGNLTDKNGKPDNAGGNIDKDIADSCCASGNCGNDKKEIKNSNAVFRALKYGFIELPKDISKSLIVGILVAALITAFIKEDALAPYLGGGFFAMLILICIGIPTYVCSTASIPIAIGFMHLGASPGAALAFLISGPATNAATIVVSLKILGKRGVIIYLATVAIGAMSAGFLLDLIFSKLAITGKEIIHHVEHHHNTMINHVSAIALIALMVYVISLKFIAKYKKEETKEEAKENMLKLKIKGMTCSHCAKAVEKAIKSVAGVTDAKVFLEKGEAVVEGKNTTGSDNKSENLNIAEIIKSIDTAGYEAEEMK